MPIYEYVCADCAGRFEVLQRPAEPTPTCAACGSTRVRRAVSLIGGLAGAGAPAANAGCGCGGACACRG